MSKTPASVVNAKEAREASDREKRATERKAEDLRAIMRTEGGRRFIWRLLTRCGVFRTSFDGSSRTFFNEGERNIGLFLLGDINGVCPELYLTMLQESKRIDGD